MVLTLVVIALIVGVFQVGGQVGDARTQDGKESFLTDLKNLR